MTIARKSLPHQKQASTTVLYYLRADTGRINKTGPSSFAQAQFRNSWVSACCLPDSNSQTLRRMKQIRRHSLQQKAKARRSGPKALQKAKNLGALANITTFMGYWDPTHLRFRIAVHVPEGETPPDVNSLVRHYVGLKNSSLICVTDRERTCGVRLSRSATRTSDTASLNAVHSPIEAAAGIARD